MPITISHALSMTTPDDPAYENKPSDWNSSHPATLNAVGSEISGAFANGNGISFGLSAGSVSASYTVPSTAGLLSNIRVSAGTTSNLASAFTFADGGGVSFGINNGTITGTVVTTYRASNDAVGLNTAQTNVTWTVNSAGISLNAGGYAGTGFTSTTTAGTEVKATNNTAGLSMAVPAFITTQSGQAFSADASSTFQTLTFQNSNGVSFSNNAGAIRVTHALIGTATAITGGASITANSGGFSFNGTALAGTGTTFNGAGISGSMTVNTAGVQLSLSGGGGVINQTGPNISAGTDSLWTSGTVTFGNDAYGSHITSNGSLVFKPFLGTGTSGTNIGITMDTDGLKINNTDDHFYAWELEGNNTAGTTGTTLTTRDALFLSGGNGMTLSGNNKTVVFNAGMNTRRFGWPPGNFTAVAALGNGSFSINRMQIEGQMSATRMDVPFLVSLVSSAAANTWGFQVTVFGAIYTKNVSTLSSVSSGSTNWSFSLASNTAGQTQVIAHAIRPMSIPMNVNMSAGEYYIGFGISTNTSSAGTATTALGNTFSVMGGPIYSSAVGQVGEFTATTNTSTGLWGGQGVYSAAISTVPPTVSLSAINQTGSYYARGNFAAIFRNI